MTVLQTQRYAIRLLNPFHGVAQVLEASQARAVSVDGINWRIQIRSEIYKTPWSSLAIPAGYDRFFVYGVWSQRDGLARIPVHPSLYQEHVEQATQDLISHLTDTDQTPPYPLRDRFELWLMEADASRPVALLASQTAQEDIPAQKQLHWAATENTDVPFTSEAFAADQARATIKGQTQDWLLRIIKQRCKRPFQGLWIERHDDGSGSVLCNHVGKTTRRNEFVPTEYFPDCLLDEHWQDSQAQQLVTDYLHWQAPLLLMLPLPAQRRRELEQQAQARPLSVHTYHRLYPEIVDQVLLNKILVEAVLRKSAAPS